MDKKTKHFVAREGLVLAIILVLLVIYVLWRFFSCDFSVEDTIRNIRAHLAIIFVLYFIYVIIRFITWAIGTLRTKQG